MGDRHAFHTAAALQSTFANARTVFFKPALTYDTILGCLYQLLVTFCLGALSTILGATYDYTHRLIHFDRREEDAAVLAQATGAGDSVSARVGCIEGRRSD